MVAHFFGIGKSRETDPPRRRIDCSSGSSSGHLPGGGGGLMVDLKVKTRGCMNGGNNKLLGKKRVVFVLLISRVKTKQTHNNTNTKQVHNFY